jgi:ADP-ribose pyrophosphatase YjhB (NUDIX family)
MTSSKKTKSKRKPKIKGRCPCCNENVLSTHERVKHEGRYYHVDCAKSSLAPPTAPAPTVSNPVAKTIMPNKPIEVIGLGMPDLSRRARRLSVNEPAPESPPPFPVRTLGDVIDHRKYTGAKSAFVVLFTKSKILSLIEKKKYALPGGKVAYRDAHIGETATREFDEETEGMLSDEDRTLVHRLIGETEPQMHHGSAFFLIPILAGEVVSAAEPLSWIDIHRVRSKSLSRKIHFLLDRASFLVTKVEAPFKVETAEPFLFVGQPDTDVRAEYPPDIITPELVHKRVQLNKWARENPPDKKWVEVAKKHSYESRLWAFDFENEDAEPHFVDGEHEPFMLLREQALNEAIEIFRTQLQNVEI